MTMKQDGGQRVGRAFTARQIGGPRGSALQRVGRALAARQDGEQRVGRALAARQIGLALVILAASTAIAAAALPKLPGPVAFPQSGDSPGVVTFNHETHVDAAKPSCTGCHPAQFPILKATARPVMKHEQMQKGSQCGACHDGKKAFAFDADCTMCHKA